MKHQKSQTGSSGFTLLELLVVLTIASLLLTVVAPRLVGTVAHERLRTSAAQVSMILRETRITAMRTSNRTSVTINSTLVASKATGKEFALPVGQIANFRSFGRASDPQPPLDFLPDGSSTGGVITIRNGEDRVDIDVDWLSGRVTSND